MLVLRKSPYVLNLNADQRRELEARVRRYTLPYRDVVRAKVVLLAAAGLDNDEIAARLDMRREIVSKWRKRFYLQGLEGLEELPRGGRPQAFPPEVVVAVKAIACELPCRLGVPLSRLHVPDIVSEVVTRGIEAEISGTTVWRWLSEDAIRPWRHRSWIFPRDPDFESKAARVLDLYARQWEGKALGRHDYVISADEKTSIQARIRRHRTLARQKAASPASSTSTTGAAPSPTSPPGTCTGQGVRALRVHDGHRAVRPAGLPGDDNRALCLGPSGLLGGR